MRAQVALIACMVAAHAAPAWAQTPPSLADVARQAQQERGAVPKAVRTITNADLVPPSAQAPAESDGKQPEPQYISKATGEAVSAEEMISNSQAIIAQNTQNMGEDHWRRRAAWLRTELQRARAKVEVLSTAPPPRTEGLRQTAARELERARKTLAAVEKRWADLEVAAGFARVPAAWLEP